VGRTAVKVKETKEVTPTVLQLSEDNIQQLIYDLKVSQKELELQN